MFVDVVHEMVSCPKSVMYDIIALNDWAKILTNPLLLTETVTENWALHHNEIKAAAHKEHEDWIAGNYFATGVDTADALIGLIGPPVPVPEIFGLVAKDVADFIAGFIWGFTGNNHLDEIEECFVGSNQLYINIRQALDELQEGGYVHELEAAIDFGQAALAIPEALSSCRGIRTDLAEIEEWAQIFMPDNRTKLIAVASKNVVLHKKGLTKDLQDAKTDFAARAFFDCGGDVADALTLLVGPVSK